VSQHANATAVDEIKYALDAAQIVFERQLPLPHHIGCVLFADQQSDLIWLEQMILESSEHSTRCIVAWGGKSPLTRLQIWQLLITGAKDVVYWQNKETASLQITFRLKRWLHVEKYLSDPVIKERMVGSSTTWLTTLRQIIEISIFSQAPVLILGESGTGKEMAARLIHQFDNRPYKQDLTLLDCSSIVPELSGSEFFGHEKGAFTNAINAREGAFATGDKGTLFLDEIGELPLHLQAELLRVVQEGTYKRLGSNQWRKTDFRLVCATNRDLQQQIVEKTFRQDLYYRISTWVCYLPPLRERKEDIPDLVQAFLNQLIPDERRRPIIDPQLFSFLSTRDYPGNVRELRQVVTRLVNRYAGSGVLSLGDIPECDLPKTWMQEQPISKPEFNQYIRAAIEDGQSLKTILQNISNLTKEIAIEQVNGNLQAASKLLQVTDRTMQAYCSTRVK
jgi:transcriptional regulator with GAF, ATPase, and Fis domain